MTKEKVHTVEGYWDGPIAGVADFEAKPHYYDVFEDSDDVDEYNIVYTLTPLSEAVFALVKKNRDILLRWNAAYEAGKSDFDSQPALPEDKEAYFDAKKQIDRFLFQNAGNGFEKKGYFTVLKTASNPLLEEFEVVWS